MNAIETLVSMLLDRIGVVEKPNLPDILPRLGLRVRNVESIGFDGVLVRAIEGSKGIIGIRRSIQEETRKRFTIAHEIGHYIIPHHRHASTGPCVGGVIENWDTVLGQIEIEANEFAAEFLLPTRFVTGLLRTHDPSLRNIRQVAGLFEMCARLTSLGRGIVPPPINPASEMAWWAARNERVPINPSLSDSNPATECILVIWTYSLLRACTGLIRLALLAGMKLATHATSARQTQILECASRSLASHIQALTHSRGFFAVLVTSMR